MKRTCRKFSNAFKTEVVLEAIKERHSIVELAERYELHPNQITSWKKEFLDNTEAAFSSEEKSFKKQRLEQEQQEMLIRIGRLNIENEW
jgi:transposase